MILNETKLVSELQNKFNRNVFIMMRYRSSMQFRNIEDALKNSLIKYGLIARLAKNCAFSDDLWENVQLYMTRIQQRSATGDELKNTAFGV